MTTMRRLRAFASVPRKLVALAVGFGAATVLACVGLMATAGYLISRAAERPAILSLTVAIVGVRFFGLARPIARYFERLTSHDLALRALTRARVRMYDVIEPLTPAQLGDQRQGDLLSRLVADVDSLQNLHLRGTGPRLVAFVAGAVAVGVAAAILPGAAVALGAGLLLAGIVVPGVTVSLQRRAGTVEAAARGELTAELVEIMRGSPEIAVCGQVDEKLVQLRDADSRLVRSARQAAFAEGAGDGLRLLVVGATVAVVLALAVSAHAAGDLDRVLVATLALLALASFEAVQPLVQGARELRETLAAGERLLELADREPTVSDPAGPSRLPVEPFTVALEGVGARYGEAEAAVLEEVDLRLEPGRRIGLVGPSGAGKTTIANLLVRFLDPERGRVAIAGRDLREYRQEDVRRSIAVAGQDSHLFSTTIRENVALGRPDATDAEVEDALRRARILDWVRSLTDGWDTLVGEEGRELSGGQQQRLVVARALLADAPVLVLDEPTAHLDAENASALIDDILEASGARTVLLITHRTEGLERMDETFELRNGVLTSQTGERDG